MRLLFVKFLFTLECCILVKSNYHWRDFNGKIPNDAFLLGTNSKHNLYYGQAFFPQKDCGILGGTLTINQTFLEASCLGYEKSNINLKILCTDYPESLSWRNSSERTLKNDLETMNAIVGGVYYSKENTNFNIYISRGYINFNETYGYANYENGRHYFLENGISDSLSEFQLLTNSEEPLISKCGLVTSTNSKDGPNVLEAHLVINNSRKSSFTVETSSENYVPVEHNQIESIVDRNEKLNSSLDPEPNRESNEIVLLLQNMESPITEVNLSEPISNNSLAVTKLEHMATDSEVDPLFSVDIESRFKETTSETTTIPTNENFPSTETILLAKDDTTIKLIESKLSAGESPTASDKSFNTSGELINDSRKIVSLIERESSVGLINTELIIIESSKKANKEEVVNNVIISISNGSKKVAKRRSKTEDLEENNNLEVTTTERNLNETSTEESTTLVTENFDFIKSRINLPVTSNEAQITTLAATSELPNFIDVAKEMVTSPSNNENLEDTTVTSAFPVSFTSTDSKVKISSEESVVLLPPEVKDQIIITSGEDRRSDLKILEGGGAEDLTELSTIATTNASGSEISTIPSLLSSSNNIPTTELTTVPSTIESGDQTSTSLVKEITTTDIMDTDISIPSDQTTITTDIPISSTIETEFNVIWTDKKTETSTVTKVFGMATVEEEVIKEEEEEDEKEKHQAVTAATTITLTDVESTTKVEEIK